MLPYAEDSACALERSRERQVHDELLRHRQYERRLAMAVEDGFELFVPMPLELLQFPGHPFHEADVALGRHKDVGRVEFGGGMEPRPTGTGAWSNPLAGNPNPTLKFPRTYTHYDELHELPTMTPP